MPETNQGLCFCLYKAYEVIMYCTKHSNHNVVTASLETLLQLLRTPPSALLSVLLSSEGITPSTGSDIVKKGTVLHSCYGCACIFYFFHCCSCSSIGNHLFSGTTLRKSLLLNALPPPPHKKKEKKSKVYSRNAL